MNDSGASPDLFCGNSLRLARMKLLSPVTAIAGTLVLSACSPAGLPPLPSPEGSCVLHTSVESDRANSAWGCVIVEVRDKAAKVLWRENTRASGFQRWNIAWISNDHFRLNSSDIGTYVWTRQPDGTWKKD